MLVRQIVALKKKLYMALGVFKMSKDVQSHQSVDWKENAALMAVCALKQKRDAQTLCFVKKKASVVSMVKNALQPMKAVKTQQYARKMVGVAICLDRKIMSSHMAPVFAADPVVGNRQRVPKKDSAALKMARASPTPKGAQTRLHARSTTYANTNPLLVVFDS